MKNSTCLSIFFTAMIMIACQPPAVFDKPQPADVPALKAFPDLLQGNYLSLKDSSFLMITNDALIRTYDFDMKVHLSQIDTNLQIIGDTLFDFETNTGTLAEIEGDSVLQHFHETDTLFFLNGINILKKFKGYYFINTQTSSNAWEVRKIEFRKGSLTISSISRTEDIDQLKEITGTSEDTIPYIFSPTKKQFKNFIRNEGFRVTEKFVKIKR